MNETKHVDETHILYRFYGDGGLLLYVGVTVDPGARLTAHSQDKPWWQRVSNITLQNFPSEMDLLRAEREAIKAEDPLYNIVHSRRNKQRRPLQLGPSSTALAPSSPRTLEEAHWEWFIWQRWLFVSSPNSFCYTSVDEENDAWQRWIDKATRERWLTIVCDAGEHHDDGVHCPAQLELSLHGAA